MITRIMAASASPVFYHQSPATVRLGWSGRDDVIRRSPYALPLLWCLFVGAADSTQMQAGVWSKTVAVTIESIGGRPPPTDQQSEDVETTQDCYTEEDVEDPEQFFGGAASDQGCNQLVIAAKGGAIRVSGTCSFSGIPFSASGDGRYDKTSYSQSIRLNARVAGQAVIAKGVITGKYLHACPPVDPTTL